jgi:hypothetical protein
MILCLDECGGIRVFDGIFEAAMTHYYLISASSLSYVSMESETRRRCREACSYN